MSQHIFDEVVDDLRLRLIVEMEYKMIGELGMKLKNKLKENREKDKKTKRQKQKKTKEAMPNGSSPRELIAATSSLPSAGSLIR